MHAWRHTLIWQYQYLPVSMDTPTSCADGPPQSCCCHFVLAHCPLCLHWPPMLAMSQQGGWLALLCCDLYLVQNAAHSLPEYPVHADLYMAHVSAHCILVHVAVQGVRCICWRSVWQHADEFYAH